MNGQLIYKGTYKLLEEIASGGYAHVFRAQMMSSPHETVALKISKVADDVVYQKSLMQEARIISYLNHRAIVQILAIPRDGRSDLYTAKIPELPGRPYFFVMEYLKGGTLDQFIEDVSILTVDESTAIALEIARGLDHMHRVGYFHNDLKLENVVFREPIEHGQPFTPVLIDFGIATRLRLQKRAGSLYIMSPERLSQTELSDSEDQIDELDLMKVDVWGMGVLLYRMLGGRLPFFAREQQKLMTSIQSDYPESLSDITGGRIPKVLDRLVIEGCLEKNPSNRVSLLELGQVLSKYGHGGVAQTTPPPRRKSNRGV